MVGTLAWPVLHMTWNADYDDGELSHDHGHVLVLDVKVYAPVMFAKQQACLWFEWTLYEHVMNSLPTDSSESGVANILNHFAGLSLANQTHLARNGATITAGYF